MKKEHLVENRQTLQRFISLYCANKHENLPKNRAKLHEDDSEYVLCEECERTLCYAYARLLECPYEEKPSCRKCTSPCYEKSMWKKMAKIMMYSGMRLGLTKIRKLFYK